MPTGSVVIVSHNSAEWIESCLGAVMRQAAWKVVLVDNASTDQTVSKARSFGSGLLVQANSRNLGFAGAVNQGIKVAGDEILIVLNPDCVAGPGSLDELARALAPEGVAAVGGLLLDLDGNPEKGFTIRRFPTVACTLAELLLLNRIWPTNPWNRRYRYLDANYTQDQEVDQPAGACLAIKRKAWEEVNGFDENFYPVWFEDVDFCRRLRDRGWKILYWPQAAFSHVGGHSVGKLDFRERQSYWYRNLLRYFSKHHSRWAVASLRLGTIAGLMLRSLLSLIGVGPSGVPVKEVLTGYWQVLWEYAVLGRDCK